MIESIILSIIILLLVVVGIILIFLDVREPTTVQIRDFSIRTRSVGIVLIFLALLFFLGGSAAGLRPLSFYP